MKLAKLGMLLGLFLIGSGVTVLLTPPTQAHPNFLVRLMNEYPDLRDSRLDDCTACHALVGGGATNDFANDWFDKGFSFSRIEDWDSDGDGFTNIEEIEAKTNPGNANSSPAPRDTPTPAPTPTPTPDPVTVMLAGKTQTERGIVLYATYCSDCHGLYSPAGEFSNLSGLSPDLETHVWAVIGRGVPGTNMSAWSRRHGGPIPDENIADLTHLLMTWSESKTPSVREPASVLPTNYVVGIAVFGMLVIMGLVLYYGMKRN